MLPSYPSKYLLETMSLLGAEGFRYLKIQSDFQSPRIFMISTGTPAVKRCVAPDRRKLWLLYSLTDKPMLANKASRRLRALTGVRTTREPSCL